MAHAEKRLEEPPEWLVNALVWGAMLTPVLRREHVNRRTSMPTAEYRRDHGTLRRSADWVLSVG